MSVVEAARAATPAAPRSLEESGLNIDLVTQLTLKTLHLAGTLTGLELATRLGLQFSVIEPSLDELKWQHHVEIVAGSTIGGSAYKYRITDAGRERAALFMEHNHYVGVAPVPLEQYRRYLENFQRTMVNDVSLDRVRAAFSSLVLSDRVLDQLGPAVRAGRSLFVYGPPGNGKTVISQCIRNLLDGEIAVPHALVVEGVDHPLLRSRQPRGPGGGRRWQARPRRSTGDTSRTRAGSAAGVPSITVGGELTLDSLELNYSPSMGFYRAPVQAIANGGVLVIDDFGRQHCSARDLLNRWIVPLESRVDFLTLQTGQKFDLPFAVLVVFATNLQAGGTGRRGVSAADSVQGLRREPDTRRFPADLRELLRAGRRLVRPESRRPVADGLPAASQDPPERMSAWRTHRTGARAGRVSGEGAWPHD